MATTRPAGWYPTTLGLERYWDGARWTDARGDSRPLIPTQVRRPDPFPFPEPVPPPPSPRRWLQRLSAGRTSSGT